MENNMKSTFGEVIIIPAGLSVFLCMGRDNQEVEKARERALAEPKEVKVNISKKALRWNQAERGSWHPQACKINDSAWGYILICVEERRGEICRSLLPKVAKSNIDVIPAIRAFV